MKLFYCDTETTGTDSTCGIHQLSAFIEIDGQVVSTLNNDICPSSRCSISEEALAVNGKTHEQLINGMPEHIYYKLLVKELSRHIDKFNKLDKFHFVAFNAKFDDDRLRDLFKRQNDNYYGAFFWSPVNCVMIRAGHYLRERRHTLPNFKLATVCAALSVPFDESLAHDAMYDIDRTRELDKKLQSLGA